MGMIFLRQFFLGISSIFLITTFSWLSTSFAETPRIIQNFTSDGCSVYKSLSHANWEFCCVAHDFAYWKGGTQAEKRMADLKFHQCLKDRNATDVELETWFTAVYEFGDDRWGSGWVPKHKPTFTELTLLEKQTVRLKIKSMERECTDLSEETLCGNEKSKPSKNKSQCIKTIRVPLLEDYDSLEKCTHGIVRTVELNPPNDPKNKIKSIKSLSCYKIQKKDDSSKTEHTLIFSPECEDGYFVFEDRKGATQAPFFVLQGFGSCKDKIKPQKSCVDRTNLRYEYFVPEDLSPSKSGQR
ncbi:MAG: hypothetical protein RJB66_447 [Pseudomonadota bacterium]|jgi:hypothetical protein